MDSRKTILGLQDDVSHLKCALTFLNESVDAVFEQHCDFHKDKADSFIFGKSIVYEKVNDLIKNIDSKLLSLT